MPGLGKAPVQQPLGPGGESQGRGGSAPALPPHTGSAGYETAPGAGSSLRHPWPGRAAGEVLVGVLVVNRAAGKVLSGVKQCSLVMTQAELCVPQNSTRACAGTVPTADSPAQHCCSSMLAAGRCRPDKAETGGCCPTHGSKLCSRSSSKCTNKKSQAVLTTSPPTLSAHPGPSP